MKVNMNPDLVSRQTTYGYPEKRDKKGEYKKNNRFCSGKMFIIQKKQNITNNNKTNGSARCHGDVIFLTLHSSPIPGK